MYDPNKTYWIQVLESHLTKEELDFIGKLYAPPNICGIRPYVAIIVSERLNDFFLYPEASNMFSTMMDPHIFMKIVKLYSIDKELAKLACIDLLKKELI